MRPGEAVVCTQECITKDHMYNSRCQMRVQLRWIEGFPGGSWCERFVGSVMHDYVMWQRQESDRGRLGVPVALGMALGGPLHTVCGCLQNTTVPFEVLMA